MIGTGSSLTVEGGFDHAFFTWGNGLLWLLCNGTTAGCHHIIYDERIVSGIPEAESDLHFFSFGDTTYIFDRIYPLYSSQRLVGGTCSDVG